MGIATTKVLAKLSNRFAKKNAGTGGTHFQAAPTEEFLSRFDVEDVWGVGGRWGERLNAGGIKTAWQLHEANQSWIRAEFGVVLLRIVYELRGVSCLSLEEVAQDKKGIVSSRSFSRSVTDIDELRQAVRDYLSTAAEKLRSQASVAGRVQVHILTARHGDKPKYSNAAEGELDEPTDDTATLIRRAMPLLDAIYREGFEYRKAGVYLTSISPASLIQRDLFGVPIEKSEKQKTLMAVMDQLNRNGRRVHFGDAGRKGWTMKRGRRSQSFTTDWKDLLSV